MGVYRNKEKEATKKLRWNQAHSKLINERNNARRKTVQDFIIQQKIGKSCVQCGISDYRVLDFHHRDPSQKEVRVSGAWQRNWGIERVAREIEKCELICANCHRILHWEERQVPGSSL